MNTKTLKPVGKRLRMNSQAYSDDEPVNNYEESLQVKEAIRKFKKFKYRQKLKEIFRRQ